MGRTVSVRGASCPTNAVGRSGCALVDDASGEIVAALGVAAGRAPAPIGVGILYLARAAFYAVELAAASTRCAPACVHGYPATSSADRRQVS
jgi:hypothetical protein